MQRTDDLASRREPISAADLVELATDVGPVPMNVAVVLGLASRTGRGVPAAEEVAAEVGRRLAAVPRMRQRLVRPSWGRRPYWVADRAFDVRRHIAVVGGDPARPDPVLHAAAGLVTAPLSTDRPLWRAVVVTEGSAVVGLVVVMHHVVADGIGGLALLAEMVDGERRRPPDAPRTAPGPPPTPSAGHRFAAFRRAHAELGVGGALAPRCSLNAPTGPQRRFARAEVDLDALRRAARRHGASINDALLVAVTGAMSALITHRGETPPAGLVVSVPVAARVSTTSTDLGNRVGVMPVRVPLDGAATSRLERVARATALRKAGARGASAALVGPLFRLLAALGIFRWFVDRQRLVNSFLTNLRGPAERLNLAGLEISRIVPLTITAGNVGAAFAAFSYAGTLGVTLIADPAVVPETDVLAAALDAELRALAAG